MSEFKFRAFTAYDWSTAEAESKLKNLIFKEEEGLVLKIIGTNPSNPSEMVYERVGFFTTDPIDSGIDECLWHRMVLDADIPEGSSISIYAKTSKEVSQDSPSALPDKPQYVFRDGREVLISVPAGRYLQLKIELTGDSRVSPVLRTLKIYYPRLTYLRYLPAIYQEDIESKEFLERYLSIFESGMEDLEDVVSKIPSYFDPLETPEDFLPWLAGWLSLDLYELLGEANREFILRAVSLYRQKGTTSGLANLVSLLTGRECYIKEYLNNVFRSYGREHNDADDTRDDRGCWRYHKTSLTVDTRPENGIIGKTGRYDDELHYTLDTRKDGRYSPHTIGIFIFLKPGESLRVKENELKKMIEAFLPVFIRVEIRTVGEVYEEAYLREEIQEDHWARVHELSRETIRDIEDMYKDSASWNLLYAYSTILGNNSGYSYNESEPGKDYRTYHSKLNVWLPRQHS